MELVLSHLIEALPGLVWTALPDGRAEFLNQRWCEYTGLSLEQAVGFGWHSALHPEDVALVLEYWHSILKSGRPGEVQARLRRFDGEYRRFLFRAAPLADKSGRVVKWCGTNTDIEERLKAQEDVTPNKVAAAALKTSESELRLAHAHLTVAQRVSVTGSFTSDLVADQHTWSDEFYRICEFEPSSKVTIQRLRAIVHPEDVRSFDAVIDRSIAGGDADFVFRIVTSRGVVKHLHCAGRLIEHVDGRPIFMGAIQDVTESKLAEEALKAREAELRRALGHLSEAQRLSKTGSFTADLARDEHIWSDGFYRICEFEPGSKITTQKLQDIVYPEDVLSFQTAIGRAIAGEDPEFLFRIVTPQGVMKHLRGIAHRIAQITDRPVFIGAVQDVTESKVAEDALNRARAELAHVSRVMTLGALTASIAHEVNQPLSGIITNATTCLSMLGDDPPDLEGARATVQRTLRDGNRASEVIKRLRAMFSRKQPTTESVNLNDAAQEVLAVSSSELQLCRIILRTDFDAGLPAVRGDRVQLQQVILNLILNAADAMRAVDDRPHNLQVVTAREEDANDVRLSVCDSGVGIDPQNIEKLFNAFYTTKSHGMGVGLSISRSIIESHQGRLWATGNDGPGATFAFSIPCGSEPAQGQEIA